MSAWTPTHDKVLRLYSEWGLSFADAARALGRTRSAVAGRAWRQGIQFHCELDRSRLRQKRVA